MKTKWKPAGQFEDIRYEKSPDGIAKITINRPEVRNSFRPKTVTEMQEAFADVREDPKIGVAILTGEGPDAFCAGGIWFVLVVLIAVGGALYAMQQAA